MAYLISSNKSHSVWCLRCRRPSCSVCVFFNSCVTFTWRADDIIRGEEEDGTCQLHKHTHTHCPTWAHYCVSSSSQLYAPQRQIHKLSKQQENKPCNETNIFMVDSFYKKTYNVTCSHNRVIKAEVCHFWGVKTFSPVPDWYASTQNMAWVCGQDNQTSLETCLKIIII